MGNGIPGAFMPFRVLNSEEEDMFKTLTKNKLIGVKHTPLLVATQAVNGINYLFFCKSLQVGMDEFEAENTIFYIFAPSTGEPHIKSIKRINPYQLLD